MHQPAPVLPRLSAIELQNRGLFNAPAGSAPSSAEPSHSASAAAPEPAPAAAPALPPAEAYLPPNHEPMRSASIDTQMFASDLVANILPPSDGPEPSVAPQSAV
jgi:hypothetical protein